MRLNAILCAILLAGALGAKCPDIPLPQPTPTPTPIVVVPPSPDPSPVCVGEGKCACYVQPKEGEWKYICCAPWVEGGVLLGDKPSDCPEPPLSLCIKPGSDYELQPRTSAPVEHINALNAALQAETGCDPSNDCKLPTDAVTFRNRLIARLVAGGLCAGTQTDAEDAPIAIGSQDDNWTYHVINFGGPKVRWQPSANEPPDHWKTKVSLPVGFPPIAQFGRGPDLSVRHLACLIVDSTPLTRSSEYCKAAFPDNPAQWYLCPFGSEDTPEKRQLGERAAGPYTWTWNGIEWEGNNGNPLQIKVCPDGPGVAKVCAFNYGSQVCQSVTIP